MKLKSYKLQLTPPIQQFEISDLADIVVLAGPNGVGKTSLLTNLMLLFQNPGAYPNVVADIEATNNDEEARGGKRRSTHPSRTKPTGFARSFSDRKNADSFEAE